MQEVHDTLGYELHSARGFPDTPPERPRLIAPLRPYRNDTSAPSPVGGADDSSASQSGGLAQSPIAVGGSANGSSQAPGPAGESQPSADGGNRAALIGGIAAAVAVACVFLLLGAALLVWRRRRRSQQGDTASSPGSTEPAVSPKRRTRAAWRINAEYKRAQQTAPLLVQSHTPSPQHDQSSTGASGRNGNGMGAAGFSVNSELLQPQHPTASRLALRFATDAPVAAPLRRIVPAPPDITNTHTTTQGFTIEQPLLHGTTVDRDALSAALMDAAMAEPAQLFAGRWQLQCDQKHGGQAVVQFARDSYGLQAIKCASQEAVMSCSMGLACGTEACIVTFSYVPVIAIISLGRHAQTDSKSLARMQPKAEHA